MVLMIVFAGELPSKGDWAALGGIGGVCRHSSLWHVLTAAPGAVASLAVGIVVDRSVGGGEAAVAVDGQ